MTNRQTWGKRALATWAFSSMLAEAVTLPSIPSNDKLLHLEFEAKRSFGQLSKRSQDYLGKRSSDSLEVPLSNMLTLYSVELELGTPAQTFHVQIDTGSSDLWVYGADNTYCTDNATLIAKQLGANCSASGVFNSSDSSTFHQNSSKYLISYGDSSISKGHYATDTLNLGGLEIGNMTFGLSTFSNASQGILGIGFASNEALASTYENLPLRLASDGIINTPAYSMWLNGLESSKGNILFGAVDHDKYTGDLVSLDIKPYANTGSTNLTQLLITFSSLAVNSNGSETDIPLGSDMQAIFDSGTSFSAFPEKIANELLKLLGATYNASLSTHTTSCDVKGSLEYSFLGANISVPFSSFLAPVSLAQTFLKVPVDGNDQCVVGIQATTFNFTLLGDTFMRNAYVVFDLKNDKIALAQAAINVTTSNIEIIKDTIPVTYANSSTVDSGSASSSASTSSASVSASASNTSHQNGASLALPPVALFAVLFTFCISTLVSLV